MRKIIMFENVSLDGYFARPNGEIDWFIAVTKRKINLPLIDQFHGHAIVWSRDV